MSSLSDIVETHNRLEEMKATQSVKLRTERSSDAHKHRGILIEQNRRLMQDLIEAKEEIVRLKGELLDFWGDGPEEPAKPNGTDSDSPA